MIEYKSVRNGKLEVTKNGEVFRIKNNLRVPAAINFTSRDRKYCTTSYCENGSQKQAYIHRLVAEAFIPNPENKPHINHLDGNPRNNNVDNLEWCTPRENTLHAVNTGLMTYKHKKCSYCGSPTDAKDRVCLMCKPIHKSLKKKIESISRINKSLKGVDYKLLTDTETVVVKMRRRGNTIQSIGDLLGLTKQRINQIVDTVKDNKFQSKFQTEPYKTESPPDTNNTNIFYPNLILALKNNKIKKQDLAIKLNVTNQTLTNKIHNYSDFKLSELNKIKDMLKTDMTIDELFKPSSNF